MKRIAMVCLLAAAVLGGCQKKEVAPVVTFGDDEMFLRKHMPIVLLSDADGGAQVIVCPTLQGRVMTSTCGGADGPGFGWINYDLISYHRVLEHFNPYGGEDRLWLGPEGGQFSIFFKQGEPFDLAHWQTPLSMDTEPWDVASQDRDRVVCQKKIHLVNYSGTIFDLDAVREVRLVGREEIQADLKVPLAGLKMVAYESRNTITNVGKEPWRKETGLLSVWILGMFKATPDTTVVLPFTPGPDGEMGPIVNDTYFGKVPANRLIVKRNAVFFRADATYRSKIGESPRRSRGVAGSYDAVNKVLTLVQYNQPKGQAGYVNSMWEIQKDPYSGDVINSYSDGPGRSGAQMGKFYEMETSSPAAALKPGEPVIVPKAATSQPASAPSEKPSVEAPKVKATDAPKPAPKAASKPAAAPSPTTEPATAGGDSGEVKFGVTPASKPASAPAAESAEPAKPAGNGNGEVKFGIAPTSKPASAPATKPAEPVVKPEPPKPVAPAVKPAVKPEPSKPVTPAVKPVAKPEPPKPVAPPVKPVTPPPPPLVFGNSITHIHRTIHLTGDEKELDRVARTVLGVPLKEITETFGKSK